ncbi:MAG: OmpP1/FadL family transporter [Kofleriaceae bacterium]
MMAIQKIIAGVLVVPVLAGSAFAGGLGVGEQNAVSSGTGGAGTARTDDPGAAWYAPAALADGGGLRLGLSLALARPALEARDASAMGSTWTAENERGWRTPPHLDASFAQGNWAAGVSVGVPFGGGVRWPAAWAGASEIVSSELMVVRTAPFGAYRFGKLRVSAGVHIDAMRLQLQRGLDFIDADGDVRLDLDGRGYGIDAAAYYQTTPELGLALAFRSRSRIELAGNANFTAPDAFAAKTPDQTASATMTMPDVLVLGAHWRRGNVAAVADLEYANWSVNEKTEIDFANESTPNAIQRNDWHDTVAVRAGAEYVESGFTTRAGGYIDPSPVPQDRLAPSSPDATRVGLTVGASYQFAKAWSADVFAEHMWLLRRETTSAETMAASYGGTAIILGAGVRFAPR